MYLIVINVFRQLSNYRNHRNGLNKWSSPVPLVGPICLIIGYLIAPLGFNPLIFLIFFIDADTIIFLYSIPNLLKQLKNGKKK